MAQSSERSILVDIVPRVGLTVGTLILVVGWLILWGGLSYTTLQIQGPIQAAILAVYSIGPIAAFVVYQIAKRFR